MKKRVIALLLCAVMLVTCMGVGIFAPPDIKLVDAESGEAVSAIAIPQSERVRIATDYESTNEIGYQWQLSTDGKTWINIYGQTGESIQLSYAMICNMLNDEGTAQVRCVVTDGDSEYETREAELSVDYSAPAQSPKQAAPAKASAVQSDAAPQADGDAEEPSEIYNIVINYKFGSGSKHSGETAYEQYAASISAGQAFTEKVTLPVITGYAAYLEGETTPITEYQFNIESVNKNISVDIVYQPATVNYTVKYFFQNIEDDKYTLDDSRTLNAKGTTEQVVPDNLAVAIDGFTSLYYERPEIAADGSTEIEIYYDRNYCLLSFDLDGGWGVEPIYARYGTPISIDQTALKKTGYTFVGWETPVPSEMPAENTICKAIWKQDNTAKVTVVIWGENADDEKYSYQSSFQIEAEPGTELTQADLYGKLICGGLHTHDASCRINCRHEGAHSAGLDCYGVAQTATQVDPNDYGSFGSYDARTHFENNCNTCKRKGKELTNLANGTVCCFKDNSTYYYYLYFNNGYYRIDKDLYNKLNTGIGQSITHGNDTYSIYTAKCIHTHTDSCYACGLKGHTTHDDSCYYNANTMNSKLWELVKSDPVTVAADGSTVMNLYYDRTEFTLTFVVGRNTVKTITEKWGADIHSNFPIKDGNKTIWWTVPNGTETYGKSDRTRYLGSIDTMPAENITFKKNASESGAKIYYYVETLNGAPGNTTYNGRNYKEYKVIDLEYSSSINLTYKEEFHPIIGFSQGDSNPVLPKNGEVEMQKNNYLYYTRNSYKLSFYNYDRDLTDETKTVQYQAALGSYNFVPEYPSALEAGAYKFDGWYTTSGCYEGSKVNFDTQTMPAADVKLFAKWVPKSYEVRVWLDSDRSRIIQVNGMDSQTVTHGNFAAAPKETPVNGAWDFIGWFYKDAQGNEKAFDFKNIPVKQDLDIYAKWGSKQPREFTVYYKALIDGTGVEIANPTKGSAIPGKTKTFYAKTGDNLNEAYREAFFPDASSKSLTVDVDHSKNVVIFWYTQKDAVPYTVRYVYEDGTTVFDDKVVDDNRKVVVTENALKKSGYLPDAMQKTLILSAEGPNVITFVYRADTQHAYYTRTHYLEDVNGEFTIERDYFEAVGDVGTTYSIEPNEYTGFTYDEGHTGEVKRGRLTQDGLDLELYYTRNSYPYTVRYLDKDTLKAVAPTEERDAVKYGKQVTETAITIPGYTVDVSQKNAIISTDERKNVITFYYTENMATINYVAVGAGVADGICSVSNRSDESVKVITGVPDGSTATIKDNDPTYKFVGWYSDEACTKLVSEKELFVPQKSADNMYRSATYYAKFEYNLTSMTLRKEVTGGAYDANDMFIFTIKDSKDNVFAKVTVTAGEEVTISGLTVGEEYTITEDNNWSWRYDNHADVKIVMEPNAADNDVTVTNTLNTNKWLGASSYAINKCVDTISYRINEFFAKLIG